MVITAAGRLSEERRLNKNRLSYCEKKVHEQLLPTWQPVAAIAMRCDIPVKTALAILLKLEARGIVRKARTRIDGHNKVHLFKKLDYIRIFGMQVPVEGGEEA